MPDSQSLLITGTDQATATELTGLADGSAYRIQNRLGGTVYAVVKGSGQPTDEFPATVEPGEWLTIDVQSGERYWFWHASRDEDGRLYVQEVGSA